MLPGNRDHLLKKIQLDTLGCRVPGKIDDQDLGFRPGIGDRVLEFFKKVRVFGQGDMAYVSICDHESIGVNRIAGVRYQHRVSRTEHRHGEVRYPFL